MPPSSKDLSSSPERFQTRDSVRPVRPLNQVARSHTHPFEDGQRSETLGKKAVVVRRPSEPAVAAAMKPLDQIGSTSTFRSSRSRKDREISTTNAAVSTEVFDQDANLLSGSDATLRNVPSMPKPSRAQDFARMNPCHTPTESNSSNESSGSDSGSGKHIDTLLQDFRFGTEQVPVIGEPVAPRHVAQLSFSRPIYALTRDAHPPLQESVTSSPDSPTDSAVPSARPIPSQALSDYNAPTLPIENGHLRLSPAPPPPPAVPVSPVRKPTTFNKGKCRGCAELIKGKSVSSADGRLTGRYHRSCFVCKTCREPFQTADFYVLDNHPFCGRHYHELNESLCKACDRGIEGQYLETELKQKYHPYCFTCQDCHKNLRDDYFEINGKTYCEQHAFRAAQQTSLLGPGRRHPERRTTRLMMM
ncbi:MAG: hypothetical protein Q9206_000102 [Seirophora lacunosa]